MAFIWQILYSKCFPLCDMKCLGYLKLGMKVKLSRVQSSIFHFQGFNLKGKQFSSSCFSISIRMSHWINLFVWCSRAPFQWNSELSSFLFKLQKFPANCCWSLGRRNRDYLGSTKQNFACQEMFLFFLSCNAIIKRSNLF